MRTRGRTQPKHMICFKVQFTKAGGSHHVASLGIVRNRSRSTNTEKDTAGVVDFPEPGSFRVIPAHPGSSRFNPAQTGSTRLIPVEYRS